MQSTRITKLTRYNITMNKGNYNRVYSSVSITLLMNTLLVSLLTQHCGMYIHVCIYITLHIYIHTVYATAFGNQKKLYTDCGALCKHWQWISTLLAQLDGLDEQLVLQHLALTNNE